MSDLSLQTSCMYKGQKFIFGQIGNLLIRGHLPFLEHSHLCLYISYTVI